MTYRKRRYYSEEDKRLIWMREVRRYGWMDGCTHDGTTYRAARREPRRTFS